MVAIRVIISPTSQSIFSYIVHRGSSPFLFDDRRRFLGPRCFCPICPLNWSKASVPWEDKCSSISCLDGRLEENQVPGRRDTKSMAKLLRHLWWDQNPCQKHSDRKFGKANPLWMPRHFLSCLHAESSVPATPVFPRQLLPSSEYFHFRVFITFVQQTTGISHNLLVLQGPSPNMCFPFEGGSIFFGTPQDCVTCYVHSIKIIFHNAAAYVHYISIQTHMDILGFNLVSFTPRLILTGLFQRVHWALSHRCCFDWWGLVVFHKFICPNAMKHFPQDKMCRKTSYRKNGIPKIGKSSSSGTSSFCGGVLIYISNVFKCALHKSGSHTRKRWVNCQVNFKAAKTSQSLKDQSITQRLIPACNSSIYFLVPVLATEHRTFVINVSMMYLTGLLINDKSI